MTVFRNRVAEAYEKRRSLIEMVFVTALLVLVCVLTAVALCELPRAIDRELGFPESTSLLTTEQRTAITHNLIVSDYNYLKSTPAAQQ